MRKVTLWRKLPLMHPPLTLATLFAFALGTVLALLEYLRLSQRYPELNLRTLHLRPGLLWIVLAGGLTGAGCLFGLMMSREWVWQLPPRIEVAIPLLTYTTIAFVLTFGLVLLSAACLRERHPDARKLALLTLFLPVALLVMQLFHERQIAGELDDRVFDGEPILQSSGSSCAAASTANLAAYFDIPLSEQEAARTIGTRSSGTSPGQVILGLPSLGLEARKFQVDPADGASIPMPAMLFINHPATGPESHAVALVQSLAGNQIAFIDPLEGEVVLTMAEFSKKWGGRGLHITPAAP